MIIQKFGLKFGCEFELWHCDKGSNDFPQTIHLFSFIYIQISTFATPEDFNPQNGPVMQLMINPQHQRTF